MEKVLEELSKHPVRTRLSLNGPLIVARDLAHSRLRERLNAGDGLPEYFKQYPVYYAGPAKTPEGYASGSFGPTTAGRMDAFVNKFQEAGRLDGYVGKRKPLQDGSAGMQKTRRFLPWQYWWVGGPSCSEMYQESGCFGV